MRALVMIAALVAPGCMPCLPESGPVPAGTYRFDPDIHTDGYVRDALVHLPPQAQTAARPLVVVVHGAFNTAAGIEADSGFSDLADTHGFVVLYPEGIGLGGLFQHWNAGHCCATAAEEAIDDVGYVASTIERLATRTPIDPARIYMVGHSNGAMFVHRFAAERGAGLAGAAAVAGAVGSDALGRGIRLPAPRHPVPMLLIHGTDDAAVPARPRPGGGRGGAHFEGFDASSAFWRRANRCGDGGCPTPVVGVELAGWGHAWPSAEATRQRLPEGHATHGFDAAERAWRFFERSGRNPVE